MMMLAQEYVPDVVLLQSKRMEKTPMEDRDITVMTAAIHSMKELGSFFTALI